MRSLNSSFSRFLAGLITGLIISCLLAGIAVQAYRRRNAPPKPSLLLKQGFDFRALRSEAWKGPAVGEKIDLKMLKAADGSGIARLIGKQPVLLTSINPACGMCSVAKDEMAAIRQKVVPLGVQYYAVCFSPVDSSKNFYEYAKSIGLPEPAFEWQGEVSPSRSLLDMTVPSHLLIDQEGTVLQVWPGSSAEKEVRKRMASQIVDDTLLINEALQSAAANSTKDSKSQEKAH
jgi:hypothetical protein